MSDNKALSVLGERNLPAHLRDRSSGAKDDWDKIGGEAVPRIVATKRQIEAHIGKTVVAESRDPIRAVMLKAGPVGRVFYAGAFQPGDSSPPDCYSNDGQYPARDAKDPQGSRCDTCRQNTKGSSTTMRDSKACRYRQNVAVAIPGQTEIFRLSLPATSIFDDQPNQDGLMSLNSYVKTLRTAKATPDMVWTEIGHDDFGENARALFYPAGWIESADDYDLYQGMLNDPRMDKVLGTGDEGHQETARLDHDSRDRDRDDRDAPRRDPRDDRDAPREREPRRDREPDRDAPRRDPRDDRDAPREREPRRDREPDREPRRERDDRDAPREREREPRRDREPDREPRRERDDRDAPRERERDDRDDAREPRREREPAREPEPRREREPAREPEPRREREERAPRDREPPPKDEEPRSRAPTSSRLSALQAAIDSESE